MSEKPDKDQKDRERNEAIADQLDREFIAFQILEHPEWEDEAVAKTLHYEDLVRDRAHDLKLVFHVRQRVMQTKQALAALENVRAILRTARATLEENPSGLSAAGKLSLAQTAISSALDHITEIMKQVRLRTSKKRGRARCPALPFVTDSIVA
jgi:hypothetical protein